MTIPNQERTADGVNRRPGAVVIPSFRQYHEPKNAAANTMKAADLIEYLEQFDAETPVIIEGFDGHLFNGLRAELIEIADDLEAYPHYSSD